MNNNYLILDLFYLYESNREPYRTRVIVNFELSCFQESKLLHRMARETRIYKPTTRKEAEDECR